MVLTAGEGKNMRARSKKNQEITCCLKHYPEREGRERNIERQRQRQDPQDTGKQTKQIKHPPRRSRWDKEGYMYE
jgi:hypothetical protein